MRDSQWVRDRNVLITRATRAFAVDCVPEELADLGSRLEQFSILNTVQPRPEHRFKMRAVFNCELYVCTDQSTGARMWLPAPMSSDVQFFQKSIIARDRQRSEQAHAITEVMRRRAMRNAGFLCQSSKAHVGNAVLLDRFQCRLHQRATKIAMMIGAWSSDARTFGGIPSFSDFSSGPHDCPAM